MVGKYPCDWIREGLFGLVSTAQEKIELEFDVGNTRIKWRAVCNGAVCGKGFVVSNSDFQQELSSQLSFSQVVTSVAISSVAGDELVVSLVEWLVGKYGIEPWMASASCSAFGVRNSYDDPSMLGVDRWLAMVAAYHQYQGAVLVIDAGSALTVDLVNADGLHQGGYIVPGLVMSRSVLLQSTGRVRYDDERVSQSIAPGVNTREAVKNGTLLQIKGFLDGAIVQAQLASGEDLKVVVTGGDAPLVLSFLDKMADHCPDLVFEGLALLKPVVK